MGAPVVMLIFCLLLVSSILVYANQPPPDAALVGNETCVDCHDEISEAFSTTLHGMISELSKTENAVSCESCHGPGSAHVEEMEPELIYNPAKEDQFGDMPTCLGCHNSPNFDNWPFAAHNSGDLNCTSCHKIHEPQADAGMYNEMHLCLGCHSDISASMFMPSHHPLREGKMSCLDCHEVHGGSIEHTLEDAKRELCFSCHADKEGPFVYEHAPVNEDCTICHTPHGSVADNLLIQTEPSLCLNCHPMHFHAAIEGIDTLFYAPVDSSRYGVSTPDAWKRGMLTKCSQCHTAVHGTDLPSQATSTSGSALTR